MLSGLLGLRGITTIKKYSSGNRESRQKLAAILRVQNAMKCVTVATSQIIRIFSRNGLYIKAFSASGFSMTYQKTKPFPLTPRLQHMDIKKGRALCPCLSGRTLLKHSQSKPILIKSGYLVGDRYEILPILLCVSL